MMDSEVTADIRAGRGKGKEAIIIFFRYLVEVCCPFVLRMIESKDECDTIAGKLVLRVDYGSVVVVSI